jgi:hypothetical protein
MSFIFPKTDLELQGISSNSSLFFVNRLEQAIDAVHSFMTVRYKNTVSQGWWNPYRVLEVFQMITIYN